MGTLRIESAIAETYIKSAPCRAMKASQSIPMIPRVMFSYILPVYTVYVFS